MSTKKLRLAEIVEFFIKPETLALVKSDQSFWAREIKILKSLMVNHPEQSFWQSLGMDFKLNSMAFFRTEKGSEIISQKYGLYKLEESKYELPIIYEDKIGDDYVLNPNSNKNKSVKNFLT